MYYYIYHVKIILHEHSKYEWNKFRYSYFGKIACSHKMQITRIFLIFNINKKTTK